MAEHDIPILPRRPRVAVALGGGAARGHAHIGILEVLEDRGYDIASIAGSSMAPSSEACTPLVAWTPTQTGCAP